MCHNSVSRIYHSAALAWELNKSMMSFNMYLLCNWNAAFVALDSLLHWSLTWLEIYISRNEYTYDSRKLFSCSEIYEMLLWKEIYRCRRRLERIRTMTGWYDGSPMWCFLNSISRKSAIFKNLFYLGTEHLFIDRQFCAIQCLKATSIGAYPVRRQDWRIYIYRSVRWC